MSVLDRAITDLEQASQRRHSSERRAAAAWADAEFRKYSERVSARLDQESGRFIVATKELDDSIRGVLELLKE